MLHSLDYNMQLAYKMGQQGGFCWFCWSKRDSFKPCAEHLIVMVRAGVTGCGLYHASMMPVWPESLK